jgi:hypothetical protein
VKSFGPRCEWWLTLAGNEDLQNLAPPAAWTANSAVGNSQSTVTNTVTGTQQFFRLSQ